MAMMPCIIVRVESAVMSSKMRGRQHQREMLGSVVNGRTSLSTAQIESTTWLLSADGGDTSFVTD